MMQKFKLTFFFLTLLVRLLHAEDMRYDISLSTTTPYKGEALLVDINLTQLDNSKVMRFNFSLQPSDDYTFHQVYFKEYDKYHALQHHYRYLVYPKKSGEVLLNYHLVKSLTDDDKVAYAISGDRDNVKGLVKEDFVVKVEPSVLKVKALPKGVTLVGNFHFTHKLSKRETEAYEPVYLKAQLKGEGNLEAFELLEESRSYHLFHQAPQLKKFHTKTGTHSTLSWDYAISAKESFKLPKVSLKAFNPRTQKTYELTLPSYAVEVKKVELTTILDNEVYPPSGNSSTDWSWLTTLFSYIVVFIAGFLMPKEFFRRKNILQKETEFDTIDKKIENTKTAKELLQLLLLENDLKYQKVIRELEALVYKKEDYSFSQIKKSLIKGSLAK